MDISQFLRSGAMRTRVTRVASLNNAPALIIEAEDGRVRQALRAQGYVGDYNNMEAFELPGGRRAEWLGNFSGADTHRIALTPAELALAQQGALPVDVITNVARGTNLVSVPPSPSAANTNLGRSLGGPQYTLDGNVFEIFYDSNTSRFTVSFGDLTNRFGGQTEVNAFTRLRYGVSQRGGIFVPPEEIDPSITVIRDGNLFSYSQLIDPNLVLTRQPDNSYRGSFVRAPRGEEQTWDEQFNFVDVSFHDNNANWDSPGNLDNYSASFGAAYTPV